MKAISNNREKLLVQNWQKIQPTRIMSLMKLNYSFARNLFLTCGFACAIFVSTVAQAGPGYLRSRHIPPGHLVVDRAANFGWNLAFNLEIDGMPVANIPQGRSYHTWLSAGPHVLTVHKVPTVGYTVPTSTTVNIQPGAEHVYVATWDSALVYLQPAGLWLTPGAYWQNRGNGVP